MTSSQPNNRYTIWPSDNHNQAARLRPGYGGAAHMSMMSEKKSTAKYRLPWSTDVGCRLVRRKSVAVTNAMNMVQPKRKPYKNRLRLSSTRSRCARKSLLCQ